MQNSKNCVFNDIYMSYATKLVIKCVMKVFETYTDKYVVLNLYR